MSILYSVAACRDQPPSATVRETITKRKNGPEGGMGGLLIGGRDVSMRGALGGSKSGPVLLGAVGSAVTRRHNQAPPGHRLLFLSDR